MQKESSAKSFKDVKDNSLLTFVRDEIDVKYRKPLEETTKSSKKEPENATISL